MSNTINQLDDFTLAYIEAALWSTNDESDESGGEPLDSNYGLDDLAPETLAAIVEDCRRFQQENVNDLASYDHPRYSAAEMGGHDFLLTRNGHGCGFWDGDWPEEAGERLTAAAEKCGEFNLYVGDDGLLYA